MNKAVPWSIKGVDFDARAAAVEAARRSGMSLGEWLNSIIADQATELGVSVDDFDESDRLEAVTARLAQMSQSPRGRGARRDDEADAEVFSARRRSQSAPVRSARMERFETEDADDETPAPRRGRRQRVALADPDFALDEAIHRFEHRARTSNDRTATALSRVARRLEEIETRLAEPPREETPPPAPRAVRQGARRFDPGSHDPRNHDPRNHGDAASPQDDEPAPDVLANIEARLDALSRRKDDSAAHSLKSLELKIAEMAASLAAKPARGTETISDVSRLESKINRILEGIETAPEATQVRQAVGGGVPPRNFARSPSAPKLQAVPRASLGDAIEQITRRQRALESASGARPLNAASPVAEPVARAPSTPAEFRGPDINVIHKDISILTQALEETRREFRARAQTAAKPAAPEINGVEQLRREMADMTKGMRDLAPRDRVSAIEQAIQDLGSRIDASRQVGVHETILRPIEQLASDVKSALAASNSSEQIAAMEKEIHALSEKVDGVRGPGLDTKALREIHAQTQEMRELLNRAIARPQPTEIIESQIAGLSAQVERLSHEGASASPDPGVMRGIGEIRDQLNNFGAIERKIETLGRKIDDAVSQSNAIEQFDELAQRIDRIQHSVASQTPLTAPFAPLDTGPLETMMADLARKLDRPVPQATDTRRLEEMVRGLGDRLSLAGAPKPDLNLIESLQTQISRLGDKVDAAGKSRGDEVAITKLHEEMARLADRFEAGAAPVDSKFAETLQQQIGRLAERLDKGDASAHVLTSLESTITDLFHRIEDLRAHTADIAQNAARTAAREAVVESLREQPQRGAGGDATFSRELADIRSTQDDADRRTHQTLTAVHETLEKVVDRLAVLEDDLAEVRPEPLASGAAPVFVRHNGAASTSPPRAPDVTPPKAAGAHADFADASAEELIEPGAGAPLGRRNAVAPQPEPRRDGEAPLQSSFIAAARRAAQAASESSPQRRSPASRLPKPADADAAVGEAASAGAMARLRGMVVARKRLMLIAVMGVVAIAATLQIKRFLTPSRTEVVEINSPKTAQRLASGIPRPTAATAVASPESAAESRATSVASATPENTPQRTDPTPVGSIPVRKDIAAPTQAASLNIAAASGDGAAQFELGVRYAEGRSVARDSKLAVEWFEKAAQKNLPPAQYRLGSHYERGMGVERNLERARQLYVLAAEAGNIRAMHNLAVLSAEGVDGKPDYSTAASWFRKAADYGVRDSQYNLAILYARGMGVEQNLQMSWAWFSLAMAQGDADAAKKREDIAARLDQKTLAGAKALVAAFKPRQALKSANEVAAPAGGWDPAPAQAIQRSSSAIVAPFPAPLQAPAARAHPKAKITAL